MRRRGWGGRRSSGGRGALEKLRGVDEELALLVDLRFFAGLTGEQTAAVLETSPASVDRAWRMARAWLRTEIPES